MMRPTAGRRDTLIIFQSATKVQEPVYGTTQTTTWTDTATEWAEVQDMLPSRAESMDDSIDMARRPCRIRCLYRSDIVPTMRVKIGTRILQIVSGPAELGRRDGIEIVCEELTTTGDAP